MKGRFVLLIILVCALAVGTAYADPVADDEKSDTGMRFSMVMRAPDRDPVEFRGAVFGDDFSLAGVVGGIPSITLFTDGKLYFLTPAIKTAREIENPPPPPKDEDGWFGWLIEPGRINPYAFAELLELPVNFDEEITVGERGTIRMEFTGGRLYQVRFPGPNGDGRITYTYSDFDADEEITADDFNIPDDFLVM